MSPLVWALLSLAGGAGAASRFLVDGAVSRRVASLANAAQPQVGGPLRRGLARHRVPMGTVVVNATACLLLGIVTGAVQAAGGPAGVSTVLGTGFLGGYSTFSTASVEGARLLLAGRTGAGLAHACGMAVLSLAAAVLGLALGHALGRAL